MFDDEPTHKKKEHEMSRGSQCVFCLLITEASANILLQAGCRQRKHINKFGWREQGGGYWKTNMFNYVCTADTRWSWKKENRILKELRERKKKEKKIEDINRSIQDTKDNVEQSGFITHEW